MLACEAFALLAQALGGRGLAHAVGDEFADLAAHGRAGAERAKGPLLSVVQPNDFAAKTGERIETTIELSNAAGHDPALDVEVFLTVWSDEYEREEATRKLGMRAVAVHLRHLDTFPRINPGFLREVSLVTLDLDPSGDSVAVKGT